MIEVVLHTFNPDDNWGTLGYAFIYNDDVPEEDFEDGYGKTISSSIQIMFIDKRNITLMVV